MRKIEIKAQSLDSERNQIVDSQYSKLQTEVIHSQQKNNPSPVRSYSLGT